MTADVILFTIVALVTAGSAVGVLLSRSVIRSAVWLLGTLVGIVFKEWINCKRRTYMALAVSIALLIAGKLVLDYGNYLGTQAAKKVPAATQSSN